MEYKNLDEVKFGWKQYYNRMKIKISSKVWMNVEAFSNILYSQSTV
jgi:hypothetical protein